MKEKLFSLILAAAICVQAVIPAVAEDLLGSGMMIEEEYMELKPLETGDVDDLESRNANEEENRTIPDADKDQDPEDTNDDIHEYEITDDLAETSLLGEEMPDDGFSQEEDVLLAEEDSLMGADLFEEDNTGIETEMLEPVDYMMTEGTAEAGTVIGKSVQEEPEKAAMQSQMVSLDVPDIKQISVDQTNNSVVLRWSPFSGASYFAIRRFEAYKDGSVVSGNFCSYKASTNQYTDTSGLIRNKVYKYVIYAFNSSGKIIGTGETFIIKINTPSVTSISFLSEDSVCIGLKRDAYATRYVLDYVEGYRIGSFFKTGYLIGDSTSFIVQGLEPGAVYTFRLRTEQEGRMGLYRSARVYKTIKMPEIALKTFKAPFTGWINKDRGICFTWKKEGKVDGFRIFRRENRESKWNCISKVNSNTTSFTDTNTEIGKIYHYSVVGYTGSREFSYKTGMSESKALVRLAKPETYAVYKDDYVLVVYAYVGSSNFDSHFASDYILIETTDKKGKKTTSYVKKDGMGNYYFSVKNMVSARLRYCKIYNNCIYPGTWSDKIDIKKALVTWHLR